MEPVLHMIIYALERLDLIAELMSMKSSQHEKLLFEFTQV